MTWPGCSPVEPVRRTALLRWAALALLLLAFIGIPFALFEDELEALAQGSLQAGAPQLWIGAAVLAFLLTDIVLPIPSSFVLSSAGYLLGLPLGALVGFAGLSCAALVGYAIGRWAGAPLALRLVGQAQFERFAELSQRHGDALLVALRAMPVLAEATAILAGVAGLPLPRFVLAVTIGNAAVALVYAGIGALSASRQAFVAGAVVSVLLPLAIMMVLRAVERRRARPKSAAREERH